jgi:DNA-binding NtrC family response regulator
MNIILIYSPQERTREQIKSALANHIALITTEDRQQFLEALKQKTPLHKAFMDVCNAEDEADLELFQQADVLRPGLKMIAVGTHATEELAVEAVRQGADGYLLLPLSPDAIQTAAR